MPSLTPQSDQQHVFLKLPEGNFNIPKWQVGENWADLYAVLEIPANAPVSEVEEAILTRGANYLSFAFTRGAKPELASIIERFLPDFRPVLLNPENRRRYNALLARHLKEEAGLPTYEEFLASIEAAEAPKPRGCLNAAMVLIGLLPVLHYICRY